MNTTSNKLFIYGSLRIGFKNEDYNYLSQYFTYSDTGKTKGIFFNKENIPVAVSSEEENFIVGDIYTLKNEDEFSWAFEQLDDYEGLHVMPGEQPLYQRKLVEVMADGKIETAWVYWYNGNVDGLQKIDTEDLLEFLKEENNN